MRAITAHPGIATTTLASHAGGMSGQINRLGRFLNDPEHGALPTLFAATQDVPGACYVGPDGLGSIRGYPEVNKQPRASRDTGPRAVGPLGQAHRNTHRLTHMTSSGTAHARASGTPVLGAVLGHITDLESVVGRGVAQVSDALRSSIGFDLVVFAGFAVDAEAQERLATGKVGATDVALLLVNPDLLVGDLLRTTTTSQTFRLYSAPDVRVDSTPDGIRVHVEGLY